MGCVVVMPIVTGLDAVTSTKLGLIEHVGSAVSWTISSTKSYDTSWMLGAVAVGTNEMTACRHAERRCVVTGRWVAIRGSLVVVGSIISADS